MQTGDVIDGKYSIEERLGEGTTSIVYKARDNDLGQLVVVKLLRQELLAVPAHRERFLREAALSAYFVSPYAVAVRDIAAWQDTMYLVLDYHPGETMARLLQKRRFTLRQLKIFGEQLLLCLKEAHRKGIRHGDIKPANLLVSESKDGRHELRLLDFGLAALREEKHKNSDAGTLSYVAPEQILHNQADLRSDLYSAAACLYQMIAGMPPVAAESLEKWAYQVTCQKTPPASHYRPNLPPALDKVLSKALAITPAERYQTAHEFFVAWQDAWSRRRYVARRSLAAIGATILLLCVLCYAAMFYQERRQHKRALAEAAYALEQQHYAEAERLAQQAKQSFPQEARGILRKAALARLPNLSLEEIPAWLASLSSWEESAEDNWLHAYVSFYYMNGQLSELTQQGEYVKAAELAEACQRPQGIRSILQKQAKRLRLGSSLETMHQAISRQDAPGVQRQLAALLPFLPEETRRQLEKNIVEWKLVATYETHLRKKQFIEALTLCRQHLSRPPWQERYETGKAQLQQWLQEQCAIQFPSRGALLREHNLTVRGTLPQPAYTSWLTLQGMPVVPMAQNTWQLSLELPEGDHELTLSYRDEMCDLSLSRVAVTIDTTPPRAEIEHVALANDGTTWLITGKAKDENGVTVEARGQPIFRSSAKDSQAWRYTIAASAVQGKLPFVVRDDAGNTASLTATLPEDITPPILTIVSPPADSVSYGPRITVRGRVEDASGIAFLSVAGLRVPLTESSQGSWQIEVPLLALTRHKEAFTLPIEARDRAGNKAQILWPLRSRYFYWAYLPLTFAMKLHEDKVWGLAFSPQGDFLVCAGNDQKIHTLRVANWQIERSIDGYFATSHEFTITPAIFFVSGMLESVSNKTKDKFWEHMEAGGTWQISEAALENSPYRFVGEFCQPQVRQIAVSPDFARFAVGDRNGYLKLVVRKEVPEIWTHKAHQGGVLALSFSASGRWLASAGGDNIVKVWDGRSGQLRMVLEGHTMPVTALAFGEQEEILASGSRDKKILLWSLHDGLLIAGKSGHTSSVTALTFDPQGQLLATGNYAGEILVWGKSGR
jgi:tRNA A-37 threonylcarbamoyl transferase component Bud32